jgi:hypothetical protein
MITVGYCYQYAKGSGFTFKKLSKGYLLTTCYGEYHYKTLKEVDRRITHDNARLNNSRF